MNTRFIFRLWMYFIILIADIPQLSASGTCTEGFVRIALFSNDIPFGSSDSHSAGTRSVVIGLPVSADVDAGSHYVELSFYEPLGLIDVTISQNGIPVYFSSENLTSFGQRNILLANLSGCFFIEIKNNNGAYAYGWFEL